MATSTTAKNSSDTPKSASRKTASRSGTARGNSARRGARTPGKRAGSNRSRIAEMPGWAATIASVVGVGVAVGVGLFATRRQWLPKAEEWGEQIAHRFGHDSDEDDYHSDLDTMADRDDDDWDGQVSHARYPDHDAPAGTGTSMLS